MKSLLALIGMVIFTLAVSGQRDKLIGVDRDGDFHVGTATLVGDHVLQPGMYNVSFTAINGRDLLIFSKVGMDRSGKGMRPRLTRASFRVEVTSDRTDAIAKRSSLRVIKRTARQPQVAVEFIYKGRRERYLLPGEHRP